MKTITILLVLVCASCDLATNPNPSLNTISAPDTLIVFDTIRIHDTTVVIDTAWDTIVVLDALDTLALTTDTVGIGITMKIVQDYVNDLWIAEKPRLQACKTTGMFAFDSAWYEWYGDNSAWLQYRDALVADIKAVADTAFDFVQQSSVNNPIDKEAAIFMLDHLRNYQYTEFTLLFRYKRLAAHSQPTTDFFSDTHIQVDLDLRDYYSEIYLRVRAL